LLGSDGEYYTQEEIHEVVDYARQRGIRVVPEFDMPGHSTAWLVGYPELAAGPGPYSIEREWGVFDPCMDPSREELYKFLDVFVGEMSALFPDEYFHIGGDEVRSAQWNANESIQIFKRKNDIPDNKALQAYFNRRLLDILTRHEKKMIGWDEIFHPDLPRSIVIQSWRGQESLAEAARQGYRGILSSGYYLDHMRPASFHYEMDPLGNESASLTAEAQKLILGGEACMWAEFVDSGNIESRIWPRAAAVAERLWSPAEVNDIPDLYRRLEITDRQLERLGLAHRSLYLEKLRRLAPGDTELHPLLVFADLLKPPSLSVRKRARAYTSRTPLNRLVDTLMPESEAAREFSNLVEKFLDSPGNNPDSADKIRDCLRQWESNDPALQELLARSSPLQETLPLAETVAELCSYGLEALSCIQSAQKPSAIWQQQASRLLETAEKPQAEILIAVFPPLRDLVEAAMSLPQEDKT
jgi:hexosaminidase